MATFDMVIDTQDMARSLDTVNLSVNGVTTSVVAMQSAVVAQEEESSRLVCKNVDNGFFMLMKSQLSQKIATCASQMSSTVLLMKKYVQDLLHIKSIMQSDYNRIWCRYKKQFNSLNKALEGRIRSLDKSAFDISKLYENFLNTNRDQSAAAFIATSSMNEVAIKSTSALLKSRAKKTFNVMARDIKQNTDYNQKVSHILKAATLESLIIDYVPSLFVQSQSFNSRDNKITSVYTPESNLLAGNQIISNSVLTDVSKNSVDTEDKNWQQVDENERSSVKNYFMERLQKDQLDERVQNQMLRLFDECHWQVYKNTAKTTGGAV